MTTLNMMCQACSTKASYICLTNSFNRILYIFKSSKEENRTFTITTQPVVVFKLSWIMSSAYTVFRNSSWCNLRTSQSIKLFYKTLAKQIFFQQRMKPNVLLVKQKYRARNLTLCFIIILFKIKICISHINKDYFH